MDICEWSVKDEQRNEKQSISDNRCHRVSAAMKAIYFVGFSTADNSDVGDFYYFIIAAPADVSGTVSRWFSFGVCLQ